MMKPGVIAIVGPTATGKSSLALELAPLYRGEIVSIDSMQVYRGMDIGTAKPKLEDLSRVPHHLVDIIWPDENFSVAEFQKLARKSIDEILKREKMPFLVGGSGLYLRTAVDDFNFPKGVEDPHFRELTTDIQGDYTRYNPYEKLKEIDPVSAEKIDPRNLRRVLRALEVYELTGIPFSRFQKEFQEIPPVYDLVAVGLYAERSLLYESIDRRVDRMIEEGLVDEVRRLKERFELSMTARQAIGYREVLDYLDNKISLEETIHKIKVRTHRFAKRQMTWFKRDKRIKWIELTEKELKGEIQSLQKRVRAYLDAVLGKEDC